MKKLLINLIWLIFMLVLGVFYTSEMITIIDAINPWFLSLIIVLGPFILILEMAHWFILRSLFPSERASNLKIVLVTPFLFLFGYLVLNIIAFSQLKGLGK